MSCPCALSRQVAGAGAGAGRRAPVLALRWAVRGAGRWCWVSWVCAWWKRFFVPQIATAIGLLIISFDNELAARAFERRCWGLELAVVLVLGAHMRVVETGRRCWALAARVVGAGAGCWLCARWRQAGWWVRGAGYTGAGWWWRPLLTVASDSEG